MTGFTKILLLAGAGLAAWYIPTLIAIYNLDFSIVMLMPIVVTENSFTTLVTVKLKNNSGTIINIDYLKAEIFLNGQKIAQIDQVEKMTLLGNSEQNFNVSFTVDSTVIATDVLKQLLAQNLQNSVLNIRGTLIGNNKAIPFNMYKTIEDLKL
ncbi:MAG: LEA type 2 family protein [Paludibacter sp.]